ncbi:ankyrin repeat domain-containing protein [candidate division CSSED10-310 bacterium]|uniref:Ankyrin repeat domain-containing protein n=1 Tax=candidate division CSSED10-310 bacterium TaxID=2855610 RepID=A0ABV6YRY8_UNCC1
MFNPKNVHGEIPLHIAARGDNINIVKLLLDHGADVNRQIKQATVL